MSVQEVSPPYRWRCGKRKPNKPKKSIVQALDEIERESRRRETMAVRNQPHRRLPEEDGLPEAEKRGDDTVLPESVLGAFIKATIEAKDERMATYTACMAYYRAWAALCSIKGIPTPVRLDESDHTGEEFTGEQIRELIDRVKFCEFELQRAGKPAFWSAKDLICNNIPVPPKRVLAVKRVLISLTGALGCVPSERSTIRSSLKEDEKERRRHAVED